MEKDSSKTSQNETSKDFKDGQSLRERLISAIDEKILEHPFYKGENSLIWGFSTSIKKSPDPFKLGSTPVSIYIPPENYPVEISTTAEQMYEELPFDEEVSLLPGEELSAEEEFEDSTIVEAYEFGSRTIHWERDWKIFGEFLGLGSSYEELRQKYGISRERIRQIVASKKREVFRHFGEEPSGEKEEKPFQLLKTRRELLSDNSIPSKILEEMQSGTSVGELRKKYGYSRIRSFVRLLHDLGYNS